MAMKLITAMSLGSMISVGHGSAPPTLAPADTYCPTEKDFVHGGGVEFNKNGWTIQGTGSVESKTTWNLSGGYIEFDYDATGAKGGVLDSLYTYSNSPYLDMDIMQMEGNCAARSRMHTSSNDTGSCDKVGCASTMMTNRSSFHVRTEFSTNGWMTVIIDGKWNDKYHPYPSKDSLDFVARIMNSTGTLIRSEQVVGKLPGQQCPSGQQGPVNISASTFTISNFVVKGSVVQGQQPTRCGSDFLNETETKPSCIPSCQPACLPGCHGDRRRRRQSQVESAVPIKAPAQNETAPPADTTDKCNAYCISDNDCDRYGKCNKCDRLHCVQFRGRASCGSLCTSDADCKWASGCGRCDMLQCKPNNLDISV